MRYELVRVEIRTERGKPTRKAPVREAPCSSARFLARDPSSGEMSATYACSAGGGARS